MAATAVTAANKGDGHRPAGQVRRRGERQDAGEEEQPGAMSVSGMYARSKRL